MFASIFCIFGDKIFYKITEIYTLILCNFTCGGVVNCDLAQYRDVSQMRATARVAPTDT